jgi:NAD(P)-dependent dehydrogenase (short-subunit alcohol dehydrogenase family)
MGLLSRKPKLKALADQVIVITGASSGIGLATARLAAERGARLVLASRNEEDLRRACDEIRAKGGRATFVVADVAVPQAVDRIAATAIDEFGGFDTWVNNAGVSIYGKLTEIPLADKRRLFDTNFWGVVHGCRSAVRHLRERGGAIINIGSIVSDRAVPLQSIYSASKHAVQGYTDGLRMELEHEKLPISVTLVKPSAIDTRPRTFRRRSTRRTWWPRPFWNARKDRCAR